MEYSEAPCSKDGLSLDSEILPNFILPQDMLEEVIKYLNNVQDLAQVRRVCHFWCLVATPLYLRKIDEIEIDFGADQKMARHRRALSTKYREKQRQIPNRKLSQKEMEEIDHEILMTTSSVAEDSDDSNMCLISKYCDYIESGGTVQYTNFKFVGINLKKNEAVRRFFCLCGKHVKILTIDAQDGYWYCDHPVRLCKECVGQQKTKCVLNMDSLKSLVELYSPNITTLTLDGPKEQRDDNGGGGAATDESEDDLSDDSDGIEDDEGDVELKYFMAFGNVTKSDDIYKLVKKFPPFNNIHTIRIVDSLVTSLFQNMFVYQLFTLCPKVTSVSNFGTGTNAFDTFTYDFVRGLVTNANLDILTELFIRNLDSTIILTLLHRHKNRLHLKFLKVNYLVTHEAESSFLEFLETQSATLETLMCGLTQSKNPQWSDGKIRFPEQMPKLTHLRIGLGKHEQNCLHDSVPKEIASIDWSKQFPALKTLMLPEFATNVTIASFFERSNTVTSTVTSLELPATLSTKLMASAGILFPNVTQLTVGYQTVDSLRQIWTMWPKLQSLHLSVVFYDERNPIKPKIKFLKLDELLTGFDASQMKMAQGGNHYVIGEPKHPSIIKLRELRELTIFDAPYRTHSKKRVVFDEVHWNNAIKNAVSDISVYHALMKLTSLKYLDISQHLHNISPSADAKLCNYLDLFHEDDVTSRNNFTIMCNHRGREEAHPMCRLDAMYKDK